MGRLLALVVLLGGTANATTEFEVPGTCPVCGTPVVTWQLGSTNSFGGQDRDFLSRAFGNQGFIVVTSTCPRCLFTARASAFQATPPDAGIAQAVKRSILEGKALEEVDAGRVDGRLADWAKLDLAAQTAVLLAEPDEELGWHWLEVAWAVRLEQTPFRDELPGEWPPEVKKLRLKDENPALSDIAAAELLLKRLPTLPAARRLASAALAGHLLRTRGEHVALLQALPRIIACYPKEKAAAVERDVNASIERERRYQRAAMAAFERALASPRPLAAKTSRAVTTYVVGETARRLGETDKAREWLGAVKTVDEAPAHVLTWGREQAARLPAAKP